MLDKSLIESVLGTQWTIKSLQHIQWKHWKNQIETIQWKHWKISLTESVLGTQQNITDWIRPMEKSLFDSTPCNQWRKTNGTGPRNKLAEPLVKSVTEICFKKNKLVKSFGECVNGTRMTSRNSRSLWRSLRSWLAESSEGKLDCVWFTPTLYAVHTHAHTYTCTNW